MREEIIKIRRELHKIPETGFKEFKTSSFIRERLISFGYEVFEVAKTGVIALKKGSDSSASIAFRSDIDALPVEEKTNLEFASTHNGYMHACGHDGHMAILLGFASYISKLEKINKDILFIFQPAEEDPGGAEIIVNEGVLEKYKVESIFGLHVSPELAEGKVGLASGPLMAKNAELDIIIKAKSSHGAKPHMGIDGVYVASQLVLAYQSIISRNIEPIEGAVITIGKISGGEARNIIAREVSLEGTIRIFNPEVFETIRERILSINRGLEKMFGVEIITNIKEFYPPVINDENLYNSVKNVLEPQEYEIIKPMMYAEDFSFYQQVVPGLFMMLGTKNEELGYIHPLHSCYFNFSDDVLMKGVDLYVKVARAMGAIG
jgi:amidohydrolase